MNRIGAWITGGLVLLGSTVLPAPFAPTAACAAESPRAVLVVDTGETEQMMCVALPESEVSGLELIELASEQHGLSYRFGYGGNAVCMLAGVGTDGDDCFEKYPDFWGYWRGDGSGGWLWSGSGAGSTRVEDGDVEGWSWGSGSDGDSHPAPPPTRFADVCPLAEASKPPQPRPARSPSDNDEREGAGGAGDGPAEEGNRSAGVPPATSERETRKQEIDKGDRGHRPERKGPRSHKRGDSSASAFTSDAVAEPLEDEPVLSSDSDGEAEGPPSTGLIALAASAALGGAGVVFARRRRGP